CSAAPWPAPRRPRAAVGTGASRHTTATAPAATGSGSVPSARSRRSSTAPRATPTAPPTSSAPCAGRWQRPATPSSRSSNALTSSSRHMRLDDMTQCAQQDGTGAPATPGVLDPDSRTAALDCLRRSGTDPGAELDLLIIGGGVVGAGAALDAATRGLKVGIVEARDWAAGTSSRSSKLIHGGLRYLEMLDFALVREALQERGLLIDRIAPHLVRPVPFLYPLTRRFVERPYVGAGIALYDGMSMASGNSRGVPFHRHLSRKGTLHSAPSLKDDAFVGSIRYYDAQVDDARLVLDLVRTAAHYGAAAANRVKVVDFAREGERVVGARL